MPGKLVKASQDKEQDLPRVSICLLFQAANYEHTHIYTHTGTHTHLDGAGRPDSPEEQGLGLWWCARAAPQARPPTPGVAPAHLPLALPPSGAKEPGLEVAEERGAHLQGVESVWIQPSEFCPSIFRPSRVGTATEHRSLCSHWAQALVCPSPSHRGDSCQHTLGRGDPALPPQLQLCPKASGHTDCTGMRPHKDSPTKPGQVTFSPNFTDTGR